MSNSNSKDDPQKRSPDALSGNDPDLPGKDESSLPAYMRSASQDEPSDGTPEQSVSAPEHSAPGEEARQADAVPAPEPDPTPDPEPNTDSDPAPDPESDAEPAPENAAPAGSLPQSPPEPPKQPMAAKASAAPKRLSPSFASTHPVLCVPQDAPAGISARLYAALALFPLLPLTIMLVLQTLFTLDARALWFSDEIRHAAAFQALLDQGKWLILEMNGQVYPDKPPLYFLFLRGLYELVRTDGPMLHFTAAAVSALLYLWAALGLGRFAVRVDAKTNLAAGIILLSTGYIMGLVHYARMDLLFSALIVASQIALYRGFVCPKNNAPAMLLGFFLAGLAVLVKGPLGLALPLCSILFFLVWRGTPQRLFRLDVLLGLIAGALPVLAWFGAIYWTTGSADFILDSLIKKQVVERALDTFHHKEAWYYYLVRLPLLCLPWVLLVFFLPWRGLFGKGMRAAVAASRKPEGEGVAFLWCVVLSALALLSALSGKILIYLLPALPALALLAARALLGLSGLRAKAFRLCMALFMILAAVALTLGALLLFGLIPAPDIKGLPQWTIAANGAYFIVAAVFFLVAALLWTVLRTSRPEGVLLVFALACTALGYPLGAMLAPSLDTVLSPKAQALLMRAYIQDGYAPASYKVYGGTYTFYAGHTVPALDSLDGLSSAAGATKTVVAMQRSQLAAWEKKPECFQEVHAQWIESKEYVLLACPPNKELKAAPVPYKPAPDIPGMLLHYLKQYFPAEPAQTQEAPQPEKAKAPEPIQGGNATAK